MIGMFVSTLPHRIQLDSHWSFDELIKHVREKCLSILEHSHYSLQNILADYRLNQSNVSFLDTIFDFITITENFNRLCLNGANLEQVSMKGSHEVAKFDFTLTFMYKPSATDNQLSCLFVCSRDLFEETTVAQIARRFQYLFEQIFQTKSNNIQLDESTTSISKFSLILPEEAEEAQTGIFHRLESIVNEGM
jgi:non-ribosomal peptide synthetase component F